MSLVSHLIATEHDGRRYSGSYQVVGDEVRVWSRMGRMSARHIGSPARSARQVLDVILAMHLSVQMLA